MTIFHRGAVPGAVAALFTLAFAPSAQAADIHRKPPADFKKVSSIANLPDFVPGLGMLYVDPSTLPVGPFLGYDRKGRLANVVYMVPLKDIDAHKNFEDLGAKLGHLRIDHTDIVFNPGHAGVPEPHYHIVEWLISKKLQEAEMK